STALSRSSRPGCTCGSVSNTSSAAPAISPERSASTSAASSTIGPRAVLTRNADDFIRANAMASMGGGVGAGVSREVAGDAVVGRRQVVELEPLGVEVGRDLGRDRAPVVVHDL